MTEEHKSYEKYLINTVRDQDAIDTAKEEGREEGEKTEMKKEYMKLQKMVYQLDYQMKQSK